MASCAICDNTNATTRLCAACRADPENADWATAPLREQLGAEADIGSNDRSHARAALQDLQQRRARRPTELQCRILLLLIRGVPERYIYRDRCGHCRGERVRWRAVGVTEAARYAGCHRKYVERVKFVLLRSRRRFA